MKKSVSKKKLFNIAMATALASGSVVVASPANANAAVSFKDVPANSTHAQAIVNLADRGIIKGYADGTFGPNKSVTRGQAAKIIAGILGLDTKNVEDPNFKDVKKTDEFYGAIAALKAKGIISGKQDGTYGQRDSLTRGQMAKIIVEGFGLQEEADTPFTDVPEKNTFAKYIKVLYGNKVTTGTTATTFSPNGFVTRGQLASFVVRAESVETKQEDVKTTISQVTADQVVTSEGTLQIDPSVAKVFNAANANALQSAEVELVVDYSNATTRTTFAAKQGKIIGVKGLTLNTPNTTFNAGGYTIPTVVVNATKVVMSQVKAETLQVNKDGVTIVDSTIDKAINVAKNITVELKAVVSSKLNLEEGSKLTIDAKTAITAMNLPANSKIEDIITNYDQVKDSIKDIIKDVITGDSSTPGTPPAAGGGGGGGGGGASQASLDKTVDNVLEKLIEKFGGNYEYVSVSQNKNTNVLEFKVVDPTITLSQVKSDMSAFAENNNKYDIYIYLATTTENALAYKKLDSIEQGIHTYKIEDLFKEDFAKDVILNFVNDHKGSATTIGDLVGEETTLKINFDSPYVPVSYKVSIVE